MAHPDYQLISRIIRTGALAQVLEWGIHEDDCQTIEGRAMFSHLRGYATAPDHRGAVPGESTFRMTFPNFELCDDPHMTLEALCAEVRKHRVLKNTERALFEASEALKMPGQNPSPVVAELLSQLTFLHSLGMKSNDEFFSSGIDDVIRRYELAESGLGSTGLEWPWPTINDQTGGLQDDDYVVLYGRPKSMKSFVLMKMAAHLWETGKCVLVYTKEMPAWQLWRRITAILARLPYDETRLGRLNNEHRAALYNTREMVVEEGQASGGRHNIICISGRDAPGGTDSMSWVRGKVEKYKPDVVMIDGLYLMAADKKVQKDEERVRQVSRAARQMVLDTGRPLIVTMQANRAAAKHQNAELDEIAYSDAIGQDATAAIRVINEKVSPTIALVFGGSREYRLHGVRIHAVPCTDFSFKEVMSEKEIASAKEGDAKLEESEKNPEAHVKRKPLNRKTMDDAQKHAALIEAQLNGLDGSR